jgi:hypothetical protein
MGVIRELADIRLAIDQLKVESSAARDERDALTRRLDTTRSASWWRRLLRRYPEMDE